jgi:hypothetical protein
VDASFAKQIAFFNRFISRKFSFVPFVLGKILSFDQFINFYASGINKKNFDSIKELSITKITSIN